MPKKNTSKQSSQKKGSTSTPPSKTMKPQVVTRSKTLPNGQPRPKKRG